jgi:hypothetical protein
MIIINAKYHRVNSVIAIVEIKKGISRHEIIPAVSNAINENHLFTAYENRFRTLTRTTNKAYKIVKKQNKIIIYLKAKPSDIYEIILRTINRLLLQ